MRKNLLRWVVAMVWPLAISCSGGNDSSKEPKGEQGAPNTAPQAAILVSPLEGAAPLEVSYDATRSRDAEQSSESLQVRWDFDGDGTWDTDWIANIVQQFVFNAPGTYWPDVEVKDTDGDSNQARAFAPVVVSSPNTIFADLDIDTNRDGSITPLDDAQENAWSTDSGAIMFANVDDDDGDGLRDGRDNVLNGQSDWDDMIPLRIDQIEALDASSLVTLTVTPTAAAGRIRIFLRDGTGWSIVHEPEDGEAALSASDLAAGDLDLRLELLSGRSQSWDGNATIELTIIDGNKTLQDTVSVRAAPLIFPDNSQPAEILYVMRVAHPSYADNLAMWDVIAQERPNQVALYEVDEWDYEHDRWTQDSQQTAYQLYPRGGEVHVMPTYMQAQRPGGGLEFLLPTELLGSNLGMYYPGGTHQTSLNFGGNLEIAPPYENGSDFYPFGRILVGGGNQGTLAGNSNPDHMASEQREWMDGQGVQGPSLELSTEWLAVGHLDEIFLFVPDPRSTSAKPWKVVFASPDMARSQLEDAEGAGFGNETVFAGRGAATTVSGILNDSTLMAYNDAAQVRIDEVRDGLTQAMGLVESDIIEVPVLYEPLIYGGIDFAAAYNPGIQNLITVNEVMFVPDPEGPQLTSGDPWAASTAAGLSPLGTVHFVDVFESYHELLGEAHCGSNVARTPYDIAWWEVEP